MTVIGRALALSLALGLVPFACSQHKNPKANLDCGETNCIKGPPIGGGGATNSDASTTDGATDGVVGDAAPGVTITGTVSIFQSDDFSSTIPYGDPATIRFDGASGVPVEGAYNGSTFSVDDVAVSASIWSTVIPNEATALPTIEPANTAGTLDPIELHVVPASTIDLIYGLLSTPVEREPGAAHVVLRFVDDVNFEPVSGVTVSHAGEPVAYDTGGSWSDTSTGTGPDGYAVVVNVPTTQVPTKQIFQYASPLASGGVEIQVAADSVTIAQVPIGQ